MSQSPPISLRYQVPAWVTNKLSQDHKSQRMPLPFPWVSLLLILDIINDPVRNVSHNEDSEFQISNASEVSDIQQS